MVKKLFFVCRIANNLDGGENGLVRALAVFPSLTMPEAPVMRQVSDSFQTSEKGNSNKEDFVSEKSDYS